MSTDLSPSAVYRGTLAAAASFLFWGLVPVYWKQMQAVPAFELIAHRIVWSLLFLLVVIALQKSFDDLRAAFTNRRHFVYSVLCSVLLASNWAVFIWAINSGHVIETSLGYFLTPLGNVALGYLFLRERLRPLQWAAIAFAAMGVAVLLVREGHFPWIALSIAGSWSLYGIFKKKSALGPLTGLTVETVALFPPAAAFLVWRAFVGAGAWSHADPQLHLLIASSGVITTIPLLLFAYGVKRLRLATLGLLQYLAPTAQFLLGVFLYHEPFDGVRLQACVLIWMGLMLYSADSFWAQRRAFWPRAA